MKVFAYENCEGDKGMIIAASLDEAREIFKNKYPERKIVDVDTDDYWDGGAYVFECEELDNKSKLYCLFDA